MTHDWFSHLEEARNDQSHDHDESAAPAQRVGQRRAAADAGTRRALGCRPGDKMDAALIADSTSSRQVHPRTTGPTRPARVPHKTTRNNVTAWWDASQIYGYDERSRSA